MRVRRLWQLEESEKCRIQTASPAQRRGGTSSEGPGYEKGRGEAGVRKSGGKRAHSCEGGYVENAWAEEDSGTSKYSGKVRAREPERDRNSAQ